MLAHTLRHSRATLAGAVLLAAVAAAAAGPVTPTTGTAKIEEIEKAGESLAKGQVLDALKHLQEAVKKNPSLPPARLMLARLLLSSNQAPQARGLLEDAATESPDHPEIYLTNAQLALNERRVTDALLNCQKALDLANTDRWTADQKKTFQKEARGGLSVGYEQRGDWAAAQQQLTAWLELDPHNAAAHFRLGKALFFRKKPAEALAELQTAAKEDPNILPAAVEMARLLSLPGDTKNLDEAGKSMDRAVKADPNNAKVHIAYADWLLQHNKPDQAKIHAEAAAKLDPKDSGSSRLLGVIARTEKDYGKAQKLFEELQQKDPTDVFINLQLALILASQNNDEAKRRAFQYAQVAYNTNQKSADAVATLGYVLYRVGKIDDAEKALQQAISGTGGQASSETAYYFALVQFERGRVEDAAKVLEGALKADGLFIFRKEAQELLAKAKAAEAVKPKPTPTPTGK